MLKFRAFQQLNSGWPAARHTFPAGDMAGQEAHGEASKPFEPFYWQLLHYNTQIPSRAPDSPIPAALGLEDFCDEDQDSAEFQLAQSPSHPNDPANPGFPSRNLHCDAELASLDLEESTQTQSSFPALPCFRASASHYTLGSSGDYRANEHDRYIASS
jgi:hypothetical protein